MGERCVECSLDDVDILFPSLSPALFLVDCLATERREEDDDEDWRKCVGVSPYHASTDDVSLAWDMLSCIDSF